VTHYGAGLRIGPDFHRKEATMASMELSAEDALDQMAPEPYVQRYAVNELYVSKDGLEAMGMVEPLTPGATVRVTALATVMSSALDDEGESAGRLCIQITDLELEPTGTKIDAASLYPSMKAS